MKLTNLTRMTAVGIAMIAIGVWGCESPVAPIEDLATSESELSDVDDVDATGHDDIDPDEIEGKDKGDDFDDEIYSELTPFPLVTVGTGSESLEFWPYTGTDFTGTPQDPINLIFVGEADARDIRAALMALDGNRDIPGLPPVPPFNSTWTDAIGDVQTAYGEPDGWAGSVIQLQCGDYEQPRFHIRLFEVGEWTVANAHFEVMIPGTTDHQVLSWELAEQFVIADFMRTGLLDDDLPMIPTGAINDAPFRTIPAVIYNGLPVELRALIQGPLGDVTEDVPIATDGQALILNLDDKVDRQAGTTGQDFVVNFGQVIPKPFCSSGPSDYLWVEGPVHLTQTVRLTEQGEFKMSFRAEGELSVTPVNPLTGAPTGETITAIISQGHKGFMNDRRFSASSRVDQRLGQHSDPGGGRLLTRLRVASHGRNRYVSRIRCNSDTAIPAVAGAATSGLLDAPITQPSEY